MYSSTAGYRQKIELILPLCHFVTFNMIRDKIGIYISWRRKVPQVETSSSSFFVASFSWLGRDALFVLSLSSLRVVVLLCWCPGEGGGGGTPL